MALESNRLDRAQMRVDSRVFSMHGKAWTVYERQDRTRGMSLVFEAQGIVRRVFNFPVHWRELPDDELLLVSLRV